MPLVLRMGLEHMMVHMMERKLVEVRMMELGRMVCEQCNLPLVVVSI